MATLEAPAVAKLLVEIGQRLTLAGENPYKARSYARAAESLLTLTVPLEEVIASGRLREIPGIGAALAGTITELIENGSTKRLEELRSEVPTGVLAMLRIPGIAPEKILRAYNELGAASVEQLELACKQGKLASRKGLGQALQDRILSGLKLLRRSGGARLLHHAEDVLATTRANLEQSHPELSRLVEAGDFRRGGEVVSDLALVAEVPEAKDIRVVRAGSAVKLWLADRSRYGVALTLATGSLAHVEHLAERAEDLGLRLSRHGLMRGEKLLPCATEEEVYAALELPFIAPELREDGGEVELAINQRLPDLVTDEDLRGLLHCHTDFSDGDNTLAEMAQATRQLG